MSGFVAEIEGTCRIVRSEILHFWSLSDTLPVSLNARSAASTAEQNLQNTLPKAANFVKDFGQGIPTAGSVVSLECSVVG